MNEHEVLTSLHEGKLSAQTAYETLFPHAQQKLKKARFIRLKMVLPNEAPALNLLLRALFIFPLPIRLALFALRFVDEKHFQDAFDKATLKKMIKYAANTRVTIQSEDALIRISVD